MPAQNAATILIIEDDAETALLQKGHLEGAGYAVTVAATADEAIPLLHKQKFSLIVLDQHLPGNTTGLRLLARAWPGRPEAPVIVTGQADDDVAVLALRAGVRDFLSSRSPDYLTQLPAAIARVLTQVQAEQQLAESEARLAGIIASARDAVLVVESDNRVSLFNAAAERMFACPASEALGRLVTDFIPYDEDDERLSASGTTMRLRMGQHGLRRSVERFPVERSISRVQVAGRKFYTVLVRDITERVEHERRLRRAARLLDQTGDAVFVINNQNRIQFWNAGAERLYGWSATEAMGRDSTSLLYAVPSAEREKAQQAVLERGEWIGELEQVTRAGKPIHVVSRWSLVKEDEPTPAILIANTDVTDNKAMESQMQRTQRLESLGVLAGGIAHDLNNVLTPILMAADMLIDRIADPESRSLLTMLRESTERGAELIRQILAFARGAEGQPQPLHLGPVAREIGKLLGQTVHRSIQINVDVPRDVWFVQAHATQIHQILMNLGVNARDAMPQGGRLSIRARNVTLVGQHGVQADPIPAPGQFVLLSVSDTGCGIPGEHLSRVFDPFFSTKDPGKGTGLGLPTTRGIVHRCGGSIGVSSEVGKGTRFDIYLPAVPKGVEPEPAPRPAPVSAAQGELILVVDDEASIRAVTQAILEAGGYRVLTATNGTEALELFQCHRDEIRAVVTDMVMPVMDGAATARALLQFDPNVRLIVATGETNLEGAPPVAGVRAVLPKPFSVDSLLQTVRAVIEEP